MPQFINQPLARVQPRRNLDFSPFTKLLDQHQKKKELEARNNAMAELIPQSQTDPLGAASEAYKSNNGVFGNFLLSQKAQNDRAAASAARQDKLFENKNAWREREFGLKQRRYNQDDKFNELKLQAMQKQATAAEKPSYKIPTGFMLTPDGNGVVAIPGGPKDLNSNSRIYSDGQVKSASFAKRMQDADLTMTPLEKNGYEYGGREWMADTLASGINSTESQSYKQAQEDWVRAKLRRESGAAIGKDEMEQEVNLYFPKYGDKAETIEQKRKARIAATRNLIRESQGAFRNFYKAENSAEKAKTKVTEVDGGNLGLSDLRGKVDASVLREAANAIARGADPAKVRARILEGN